LTVLRIGHGPIRSLTQTSEGGNQRTVLRNARVVIPNGAKRKALVALAPTVAYGSGHNRSTGNQSPRRGVERNHPVGVHSVRHDDTEPQKPGNLRIPQRRITAGLVNL